MQFIVIFFSPRDWRQEGREDNDREDNDREMPFRRGGETSQRGGSDDKGLRRGFDDERGPRRGGDDDRGPRRALMMIVVGSGGALMMTVGPGGALTMTADQGVEWTMTVAQEEALTKTVDPVEAWMNSEGLDVGQMMTGAPEEEGMMRGEAAGVWMTLAHVVEMTLQHGNLLGNKVQAHVVFLFLLACCQICVLKGSYHEKYIFPVTKQCDTIMCYWSME